MIKYLLKVQSQRHVAQRGTAIRRGVFQASRRETQGLVDGEIDQVRHLQRD